MKLKGIGWIEQHIEKIVLAVFAIIFLGVFVLQFDVLGDPNAVEISGRKVSPENAAAEIATKARQLQADLDSGRVPSEFPDKMPSAADFVRDQLDRSASDADKIADVEWEAYLESHPMTGLDSKNTGDEASAGSMPDHGSSGDHQGRS